MSEKTETNEMEEKTQKKKQPKDNTGKMTFDLVFKMTLNIIPEEPAPNLKCGLNKG